MLQNINWGVNDYLSASKMRRMVDNDNYNHFLATSSPRGILHSHNITGSIAISSDATVQIFNINPIYSKAFDDSKRFIKIALADCTITDTTAANQRRGVVFEFEYSAFGGGQKSVEVISRYGPVRVPVGGTAVKQGNWRTAAAEFIIVPTAPDFSLRCTVRQRASSSGSISLTAGSIIVYDAGVAP
jgi:hypothetical protein